MDENKRPVESEKAVVVLKEILTVLLEGQTNRKSGKGANTVRVWKVNKYEKAHCREDPGGPQW